MFSGRLFTRPAVAVTHTLTLHCGTCNVPATIPRVIGLSRENQPCAVPGSVPKRFGKTLRSSVLRASRGGFRFSDGLRLKIGAIARGLTAALEIPSCSVGYAPWNERTFCFRMSNCNKVARFQVDRGDTFVAPSTCGMIVASIRHAATWPFISYNVTRRPYETVVHMSQMKNVRSSRSPLFLSGPP